MKYRATIRRTVVTDAMIEIEADNISQAAKKADEYASDALSSAQRRKVRVVRPYEDDPDEQTDREVIAVKEVPH